MSSVDAEAEVIGSFSPVEDSAASGEGTPRTPFSLDPSGRGSEAARRDDRDDDDEAGTSPEAHLADADDGAVLPPQSSSLSPSFGSGRRSLESFLGKAGGGGTGDKSDRNEQNEPLAAGEQTAHHDEQGSMSAEGKQDAGAGGVIEGRLSSTGAVIDTGISGKSSSAGEAEQKQRGGSPGSPSAQMPGRALSTGGASTASSVASRWRRAAGRGILHRRGLRSGDVSKSSAVAQLLQGKQLRRKKAKRDLLQLAVAAMGGKVDWGELMQRSDVQGPPGAEDGDPSAASGGRNGEHGSRAGATSGGVS